MSNDAITKAMQMPIGAFENKDASYIDGFNAGRKFVADKIRNDLKKRSKEDANV